MSTILPKLFGQLGKAAEQMPKELAKTATTVVNASTEVVKDAFVLAQKRLQSEKLNEAAKMVSLAASAAQSLWADAVGALEVWPDAKLPVPPAREVFIVASYNLQLGGQGVAKSLEHEVEDLGKVGADVLCLQDCTEAQARALGAALGMHIAFTGKTQKAILSRYPIELAEELPFESELMEKVDALFSTKDAEAVQGRSILRVQLLVGTRGVEVLDTHLSLHAPTATEKELTQLVEYVSERGRGGRTVILAGDFKANVALAGHLQHGWHAAEDGGKADPAGAARDRAQAELAGGTVPRDSDRYRELLRTIGISEAGASKRFDNILASRDVDLSTRVHLPEGIPLEHPAVLSEIRWKTPAPPPPAGKR